MANLVQQNFPSTSQKIIRILYKPKVHYRVHNSLPFFHILKLEVSIPRPPTLSL